ncbi:MAG: acyltransferase family protein [Deltaproteobacteria bacterium]|nr:acyltransferase family protein [Deltaproteobacteria bacterium]
MAQPKSEKGRRSEVDERIRTILSSFFGRPFGTPRELLQPLVDAIESSIAEHKGEEPFQRDPELVESALPYLKTLGAYFDAEVRGFERVPKSEPCLIVANHSGGIMQIDAIPFVLTWLEQRGNEAEFYSLAYDLLFSYPVLGPLLRRFGALPASHENARRALDKGAPVLVFPGGDYEVFRPWKERNRIEFGGRTGFIELAISAGVRVIPMTIHGAHESTLVLTRGHDIAKMAGFDRVKIKVFPFIWNIPFGLTPAFVPSLPLPAKITVEMGEPLDWSHFGPELADDPETVQGCYDEITGTMQSTLDRLGDEFPYPVLTRLNDLRPSRILSRLAGALRS